MCGNHPIFKEVNAAEYGYFLNFNSGMCKSRVEIKLSLSEIILNHKSTPGIWL